MHSILFKLSESVKYGHVQVVSNICRYIAHWRFPQNIILVCAQLLCNSWLCCTVIMTQIEIKGSVPVHSKLTEPFLQ